MVISTSSSSRGIRFSSCYVALHTLPCLCVMHSRRPKGPSSSSNAYFFLRLAHIGWEDCMDDLWCSLSCSHTLLWMDIFLTADISWKCYSMMDPLSVVVDEHPCSCSSLFVSVYPNIDDSITMNLCFSVTCLFTSFGFLVGFGAE